jgi:1-aminocyclopropane-1-carboxylate deaminase
LKNLEYLTSFDSNPAPLVSVILPWLQKANVNLYVKREDLRYIPAYDSDKALGGNKLRKLKYSILHCQNDGMATYGGMHSNHIAALASAGLIFNFRTIGLIRGELCINESPTLQHAIRCGMKLIPLNRSEYRLKEFRQTGYHIIPEGGTNHLAIQGVSEMVNETHFKQPCTWICPVGTAGTIKGIISALDDNQKAIGISVLKGIHWDIPRGNILTSYHLGGYGKWNNDLIKFILDFYDQTGIPLDPIYTGKMFYALKDLIEKGFFEPESNLIAVHTGGLQGIKGFNQRFKMNLPF